jgi:signal transduction histidine kinase
VCVDAWTAEVTAQATQALSVNAIRSGELAEEIRWQLVRLTPGPGIPAGLDPSSAQALVRLARDVSAYEKLATSDEERREWEQLSRFSRELADAWSHEDDDWATHAAAGASASAEQLIALNHADADAIGSELVSLGRSQIAIDAFAGAVALFAFAQVARARVRSLERERSAIARHLGAVEEKNRELEAFAGRVAHDLRAPLTPVHALAGLLVRGGQGEGDVRRIAGKIVASTTRMSSLIDAMLAFSQSGRPPSGECLAGSVLAEVLEELRPESEGAEIHVELPEARLSCAPEVFAQIVRNLVGNALKYRCAERPARVQITGTLGLQMLTLIVEDNGIGMSSRAVCRAFEPFFRATVDRPGHGLGLAIVDRYVRALGGSIALNSDPGVGTRVEVRLPGAPASAEVESIPSRVATLQIGAAPAGVLRSMG